MPEELKSRVRFCWECSRQLWGNHFVEREIDGYKRILHKQCAKSYPTHKCSWCGYPLGYYRDKMTVHCNHK